MQAWGGRFEASDGLARKGDYRKEVREALTVSAPGSAARQPGFES